MTRAHQLFPTPEEAANNPELIFSDHLPVKFHVALKNKTVLDIISWNILATNTANGFNRSIGVWETEEQCRARYKRIEVALQLFMVEQQPQIIVLQEADTKYFENMQTAFPEYVIHDTGRGPVMLVRKSISDKMKSIESPEKGVRYNNVYMQANQTAVFDFDGTTVAVNNVHTRFYETPENHEAYYTHVLSDHEKAFTNIVVGDTNTRIAPVDTARQNITTGAVPLYFNKPGDEHQYSDFPDAAFIKHQGDDIQQVTRQVLDYRNGRVYQPEAADLDNSKPKSDEFRMLMCLTDYQDGHSRIAGKTVFEYQAMLREKCACMPDLLVRKAAKDNNERGFAFKFGNLDNPVSLSIIDAANKVKQENDVQFRTYKHYDDAKYREVDAGILYVHENKMPQFLNLVTPIVNAVSDIDTCIARIRRSRYNLFLRDGNDKIARLQDLRTRILDPNNHSTIKEIVDGWENENVQVNGHFKSTAAIISEHRNRFVGTIFYRESKAPLADTRVLVNRLKA